MLNSKQHGSIFVLQKIWYGTNYTTSVVHKDAADNINCLVYGVKNYTITAPKYDVSKSFSHSAGAKAM